MAGFSEPYFRASFEHLIWEGLAGTKEVVGFDTMALAQVQHCRA